MANLATYDAEKLSELKKEISEKCDELLNEMNKAISDNDGSAYISLKQRELQCQAELRLIKHIENGFKDKFLIC